MEWCVAVVKDGFTGHHGWSWRVENPGKDHISNVGYDGEVSFASADDRHHLLLLLITGVVGWVSSSYWSVDE
jgi:hypothetical protein